MAEQAYVYIMASQRNGIYVGSTVDLVRRVWEHRNDVVSGFTAITAATCLFGTKLMAT